MPQVASLRTVALQLRVLSADSESQPIIARDEGCLGALKSFICGTDADVARIALAAVQNLVSHEDNHELLRSERDLSDALRTLVLSDAEKDLRQDAFDILEELVNDEDDGELLNLEQLELEAGLRVVRETSEAVDLMKDPVSARLRVPGISDDVFCIRVEQLVIRKKGVISVVFEIGSEVAVIFTRVPVLQLAHYLRTMTGTNVEILPEECVMLEEKVQEKDEHENGQKRNDNAQEPGYLDDTGRRLRAMTKMGSRKDTISQGASSLHDRLRAQRDLETRQEARATRLMNSLGRGMSSGWGCW